MDIGRLIQMTVNRFLRRALNKGINHMAGKGKPASQMTKQERTQAANAGQLAKRARQVSRITRRLGRF